MKEVECLSNLLQVCTRKTEEFAMNVDDKYVVWLLEIEEEARKMFSSDFNTEPELMPKTPSQKRRRKKRTSIVSEENQDSKTRRISRRKSGASWRTSVRRLSTKYQNKLADTSIQEIHEQPRRVTRAQANIAQPPAPEKRLPEMPVPKTSPSRLLQVNVTAEDRKSAELLLSGLVSLGAAPPTKKPAQATAAEPSDPYPPKTPEANNRCVGKLKIAHCSTPKLLSANVETIDLTAASPHPATESDKEQNSDLSDACSTPTGSRSDRRSVRRSLVNHQSTNHHTSLVNKYSLASKRESMTREAVRKSIRRSISKKKAAMDSSSSYKSYQGSIEVVDDEVTVKMRADNEPNVAEAPAPESTRQSLRSRGYKKIAISNLPESDTLQKRVTRGSVTAEEKESADRVTTNTDDAQVGRRKSYKRAVDEISDDEQPDTELLSPPRKKTPSPTCPPSKVVRPPPHMKSFLHTVQKNQLLMMTPGSIGKSIMVKTFLKRNTPLKTDPKTEEKERLRLEAVRKKEEAENQRKQKLEEGKKRAQEQLKIRREERLRKVLQARERVEQLEEEKKKKIEQKFAQSDEKSEKVREDRLAEEKAKKKLTAKKQEEAENRRKQEDETRRLKTKQMEEEERKHQEQMQKKREEEEQERQRKIAEAKKLTEQRQAELEREKQRGQQLAAEKEQERLRLERERELIEKERALQLQKELDCAVQEKEERKKEMQQQAEQEHLEKQRKEEAANVPPAIHPPTLNVTVDISNSPACESYEMTPKSYKVPTTKINPETYGMDLNSDDSTDDESMPRKPIPAWASGNQLSQAIRQQYYNPMDVDRLCGIIENPKLEDIFNKNKPRYFKRTSSAVWHSPPMNSTRQQLAVNYGLKKY